MNNTTSSRYPIAAAFAMFGAAASWAVVPAILHLTLHDTNAFLFGGIQQTIQAGLLLFTLLFFYHRLTKPPPRYEIYSRGIPTC